MAERGSKRPKQPMEIRKNEHGIDEIVAVNCDIHIERLDRGRWFLGVSASDGSYWQFWFGAKNRRASVDFDYHEAGRPSPAPTEK
jgi:hypothetical protein